MKRDEYSQFIRRRAQDLGFIFCGIARAAPLDKEAHQLEAWLMADYQGDMSYMERYFDLRVDPTKLVPGAKSVISLAYNYYTDQVQQDPDAPKIATYAYGRDYHKVVRKKLKQLMRDVQDHVGDVQGRVFVDSGPVMEHAWALRAGIGWSGKHTLTIHPRQGSYFFLAECIIDLDLAYDTPMRDHCGTCTRCIDACPTDAISEEGYIVDASKCISYLTIEKKDALPEIFSDHMEGYVFGCDICQQVCPWNRFASPHTEPSFHPKDELMQMSKKDWEEITHEVFDRLFEGSAVKRTGYDGLRRNINFISKEA